MIGITKVEIIIRQKNDLHHVPGTDINSGQPGIYRPHSLFSSMQLKVLAKETCSKVCNEDM